MIIDGAKLREARGAMSLRELAQLIHEYSQGTIQITRSAIQGWEDEKWRPRPEIVPYLQAALGVPFDQIARQIEWPAHLKKKSASASRKS